MLAAYFYLFIITCLVSILATLGCRHLALRWKFLDHPSSKRKIHKKPTPLMGGVALLFSFFFVIWFHLLLLYVFHLSGILSNWIPTEVATHLSGVMRQIPRLVVITLGGFAIAAVGLYDDKYSLKPKAKLAWQIGITFFVVLSGIRLSIFIENDFITIFISMLWLILIINSFNLLDNMDGLSAGVAFIASTLFALVAIWTKQYFLSASLLTLAGSLAGFWFFNTHPAKIFMGDCGSQLIGFLIGVFTILETFYQPFYQTPFPILMPLLILAVPLYDTASVVMIRILQGESIFKADKRHFSHRIQALGVSTNGTVRFIYLVTLAIGLAAPVLPFVSTFASFLLFLQALCVISIVAIMEYYGDKKLTVR